MTRKDGLTPVFKMFLGDVVYAVKRMTDDTVLVKTILYDSKDDEFKKLYTTIEVTLNIAR